MWNRCWGSSRASGRAGRGLRVCAQMCATALWLLPWHCREKKGSSDTCHPARELPRCREPCQALIQEQGLLILPRGRMFRAAAGKGAQLAAEQMPRASAPGKLQEDSSPRSNPGCRREELPPGHSSLGLRTLFAAGRRALMPGSSHLIPDSTAAASAGGEPHAPRQPAAGFAQRRQLWLGLREGRERDKGKDKAPPVPVGMLTGLGHVFLAGPTCVSRSNERFLILRAVPVPSPWVRRGL